MVALVIILLGSYPFMNFVDTLLTGAVNKSSLWEIISLPMDQNLTFYTMKVEKNFKCLNFFLFKQYMQNTKI